jgi:hypothetical protein
MFKLSYRKYAVSALENQGGRNTPQAQKRDLFQVNILLAQYPCVATVKLNKMNNMFRV